MYPHTLTHRLYTSLHKNLVNVELTEKCKHEYKYISQYSELHDSLYVSNFCRNVSKIQNKNSESRLITMV